MTGNLHEISRVIGALEEGVAGLKRTFDQHAADDDRRHEENVATLRDTNAQLAALNQSLVPLAKTVAAMQPVVDSLQIDRWKLVGALGVLAIIMTLVGWLISLVAGKAVAWAMSLFLTGRP